MGESIRAYVKTYYEGLEAVWNAGLVPQAYRKHSGNEPMGKWKARMIAEAASGVRKHHASAIEELFNALDAEADQRVRQLAVLHVPQRRDRAKADAAIQRGE